MAVELLDLHLLRFDGFADILQHAVHLFHFLCHRLHLHLGRLQFGRFVAGCEQFRVDGLGKPRRHFLRARPIHVFDKQVAGHRPQLRVALQQLRHRVQRFLPFGHVARAGRHRHVVFADVGVVNFLNDNALFVLNFFDRHRLHRVNHGLVSFAVHADNPRNALRVVNLRNQIDQLPRRVTNGARQVVHVVISAGIRLLLPRQDGAARAFVAGCAQTGVILACRAFNVV